MSSQITVNLEEIQKPKRGLPLMPAQSGGSEMLFGKKKDKQQAGTAIDPICKMTVPTTTHRNVEHGGRTYYFCSDSCMAQFKSSPAKYA